MSKHWNSYGKYLLTGVVLGSFLFYAPTVTEAKRVHKAPQASAEVTVAVPDVVSETSKTQKASRVRARQTEPKLNIREDLRGEDQLHPTAEKELSGGSDFQSRIHNILYPSGQAEQSMTQLSVPATVSAYDDSIIGTPLASQEQCVRYLLSNNPNPDITVTPQQLVSYYYQEGAREGIRPDVAFAQALKETGFFRYGGDVIPEQNNFCGLGTTGGGVKGAFFPTAQMGVRAHIQHLLAYSSTREPSEPVVDPRYQLVRDSYGTRTLGTWEDLNGRWAVPGYTYGQSILSMFRAMLTE
ncbi:glucosaminidase domain-containing protein [uncultured Mitsuokella sp.]|uniref:glucosaminidase domain-containing protein n=1 Tax=uncultured Mitsuokella sp. TaxID=453120 RepID=UPI0025FF37D7|nr:glucosaminidase domain-containing protein [uncultured Mitsuokella sp.]